MKNSELAAKHLMMLSKAINWASRHEKSIQGKQKKDEFNHQAFYMKQAIWNSGFF